MHKPIRSLPSALALHALLLALSLLPAWAQTQEPIKLGLLPIFSARTLIGHYQPVRSYLERELQRPVVLLTAADFRHFYRDLAAGEFDLAVSAPHMARLAQTEHGMLPLAIYRNTSRAVLIAAKARPVTDIQQLRGQRLATFDPMALNVRRALAWLAEQGLVAGRDFQVIVTRSHTSVAHAVSQGEALLGVTAPTGHRAWTPEMRQDLEIYRQLPPVPSLVWLAHPRLAAHAPRLRAALLRFPDTPEGRLFFGITGYEGLREPRPGELEGLETDARELARLLQP